MARKSGSNDRVADVMATLGATLAKDGQTASGLQQLDEAVLLAHGETLARVQMRRAHVHSMLGEHSAALADLRLAIKGIRRAKDPVWEARALNNRCLVHLAVGAVGRADLDSRRAERLFLGAGQQLEAVHVLHNRGIIAQSKGDPTAALRLFGNAADRYAELVGPSPELAIDRCRLLLDLGLINDAVGIIEFALQAPNVSPSMRPELMLTAAGASLAGGDAETARVRATAAARIFRRQHRPWWVARTTLVAAQAAFAAGKRDRRLLTVLDSVAATLDHLHADESAAAHLLAGRLAAVRRDESSRRHFEAAARHRLHGSSLGRAAGWLAQALLHDVEGRPRGVLASCARGLDALDEHRLTLGSSELRALASSHGAGLAELALRQVVHRPAARGLLIWTERVRSSALTMPLVRPPPSTHAVAQMAAYREASRRLEQARANGENLDRPLRARDRAEAAIRRDRHQIAGRSADRPHVDLDAIRDELGETTLIEIVQVDGILHAVALTASRITRHEVGPLENAIKATRFALFGLRRAAVGRTVDLAPLGAQLQRALLGSATRSLGDGHIVIAPPVTLLASPWGLLPALADRVTSISPSSTLWLRSRQVSPRPDGGVVLIAGPGLVGGPAEIAALHDRGSTNVILRNGTATVDAALQAMSGASLVHIAAHGHFRADNPLFSNLALDDGPLTMVDIEGLEAAPYRMVLSACDSGVGAPVGADETLGMVTTLLSAGSASIMSSVCVVDDMATIPVMVDVHAALERGDTMAEALLNARRRATGDRMRSSAAASFLSFGS